MKVRKQTQDTCRSSRKVTAKLLLSFLALTSTSIAQQAPAIEPWIPEIVPYPRLTHDFTLRQIFHRGLYQDPNLHKRLDIRPESKFLVTSDDDDIPQTTSVPHFSARASRTTIERLKDRQPSSIEKHLSYARLTGEAAYLEGSQWTMDEVDSPDVTDKETVLNLAIMAADAYVTVPGETEWEDVSQGYNYSQSFGWEGDGLRGHIFADKNNETIIMSLKGTSPAVFDGDGTTTRDKLNDNLFFSCCCAQGGQYFWRQVCDCYSGTFSCNRTCLVKALRQENRYYRAAIELYTNVTELYPTSNVWLVGHSLGGSVSSLLGLTFGVPAVTFEAPGEALAAQRLGLPSPPSTDPSQPRRTRYTGSVHIGHTADPVFMGSCNGATATCTLGGYAMETQCHSGLQCVYDTVEDFGWRVGIGNHKIHVVIDTVIRKYDKVPECIPDNECVDCFNWKYFDSNGSDSTTRSSTTMSSTTTTRTSTCKTPGWWGCLDDTTTTGTTTSTPVITTTFTTTSCATPGWFGCNKEVNVTVTTTTLLPTATIPLTTHSGSVSASRGLSSSCRHPGWLGCNDPIPSTTSSSYSSTSPSASPHTCETPGFFFGCRDRSNPTSSSTNLNITPPPSTKTQSSITGSPTHTKSHKKHKCKHPVFFGLFCGDGVESYDGTDVGIEL